MKSQFYYLLFSQLLRARFNHKKSPPNKRVEASVNVPLLKVRVSARRLTLDVMMNKIDKIKKIADINLTFASCSEINDFIDHLYPFCIA
jgi:hypothetical protein